MRHALLAIIAMLLLAPFTKADAIPVFAVSGSMAFDDGTDVTFSFLWTYTELLNANEDGSSDYLGNVVPGSFAGSEGGNALTLLGLENGTYLGMFVPQGLFFDTFISDGVLVHAPVPITLVGAQMYGVPGDSGPEVGTLTYVESPVSTPEPSSLLLLFAAAPIFLIRRRGTS